MIILFNWDEFGGAIEMNPPGDIAEVDGVYGAEELWEPVFIQTVSQCVTGQAQQSGGLAFIMVGLL